MRSRSRLAWAASLVLVPLIASACSSSPAPSGTSGSGGAASGAAPAKGACAQYEGKEGVVRTFCDGKATGTITLGSVTKQLTGGECVDAPEGFSVNFGVVTQSSYSGTRPDYVAAGLYSGKGLASGVLDGTLFAAVEPTATVSPDKKKVKAEGKDMRKGTPILIEATCP